MNVLQIVLNIFLSLVAPSTVRTPKWSPSVAVVDLNSVCISLLPMHTVCLTNLAFLYLIIPTILGEECRLRNSWLWNFLSHLVLFFLLSRDIPVNILFPNTLRLWPFLRMRNTFSHTLKRASKSMFFYILILYHGTRMEYHMTCASYYFTFKMFIIFVRFFEVRLFVRQQCSECK
jgi:hypothetical protein